MSPVKRHASLLAALAVAGIVAIVGAPAGGRAEAAEPDSPHDLVAANNAFGFSLLARLAAARPQANIFLSPASVAFALAMTANGAAGETQEAMRETLQLAGMAEADVNAANALLMNELLTADESVELALANSLWLRLGVQFRPDFLVANRTYYDAEVTTLDFASEQAAPWINAWVSSKTHGKIARIVTPPIDAATIMFLVNAVYFKGAWSEPFDPAATREEDFHLPGGGVQPVPLMHRFSDFRYLETEDFQAVSLPDGAERLSMYVFLPREDSSLEEFLAGLTPQSWEAWLERFSYREGLVGLPRFKLEYEAALNDALTALGMGVAFDPLRADFSRLASSPFTIFISKVKHKTYLDVNELGTEAAAVTSVEIALTAAPDEEEPEPFTMIVNRPFFLAIRDRTTGVLLFVGCVVAP